MRTVLYSISTGYFARNLLRTGVIEKLLLFQDVQIVIVTMGHDDEEFIKDFSFSDRIFIEKMYEVDRSYDFIDKLIWKSWKLGHSYKIFQELYKFFLNFQSKKRYYNKFHKYYGGIFDKYKPDLVIGGTPGVNSKRDLPIFAEAQIRRIKTLALIHSWDNIAERKGPMWVRPAMLGVWNEFQKQDAIEANFFKEEDVVLIGPPHFDIYWRKETFMGREAFFKKMGLDPNKKLVSMIATAPDLVNNSYIVEILLDALRNNKFVLPTQLLCRPTPNIDPERNKREFGKYYNEADIVIDYHIQHRPKLGWTPDKNQLYHFANLVKYTDVQVSIVSTSTVEAVILDKPVVNISFSTVEPEKFQKLIVESVFSNHFKSVLDCGASYITQDPEDLIAGINKYLLDPTLHRQGREKLKKSIVYKDDGQASERVFQTIVRLLPSSTS